MFQFFFLPSEKIKCLDHENLLWWEGPTKVPTWPRLILHSFRCRYWASSHLVLTLSSGHTYIFYSSDEENEAGGG